MQFGGDDERDAEFLAEHGVYKGHQRHLVEAHLDRLADEVVAELLDQALGDRALDDDAGDVGAGEAGGLVRVLGCGGCAGGCLARGGFGFGGCLGRAYGVGEGGDGQGGAGGEG